jgi:hypothetical protein
MIVAKAISNKKDRYRGAFLFYHISILAHNFGSGIMLPCTEIDNYCLIILLLPQRTTEID